MVSEQESNICEICGGVKSLGGFVQAERDGNGVKFLTYDGERACIGHPEPARDITYGDLGDHAAAFHDESWGYDQIAIRAKGEVRIHLDPRQFLRLLDWGTTHRAAIERLAESEKRA